MPRKQRGVFEKAPGSGEWWIEYHDREGQRHRESIGTYNQAVDAYYARKVAIREGRWSAPRPPAAEAGITFYQLVTEAFADRRQRLTSRSYQTDEVRIKPWLEWWGTLPASQITKSMIAEKLRGLLERSRRAELDRGISGPTANRYLALLSGLFKWGISEGMIQHNPARDVPRYRESDGRVRFLSSDEEAAIRKVIQEDYPEREAEFDILLHTGMRRMEMYGLTWDRVDLERRMLTIQGKARANSRKGRVRYLPINPWAEAAFRDLYSRSNGSPWVCSGPHKPNLEQDWRDWLERAVKRAGVLNFTKHDTRHTFASRLVMQGVSLRAVQLYLGHQSIGTTERYSHLAPDYQREQLDKLGAYAPGTAPKPVISIAKRRKVVNQ